MRVPLSFEKMNCLFFMAQVESLEKSRECFSLERRSSSALLVSSEVRVEHRMLYTGRGLDPICASGVA